MGLRFTAPLLVVALAIPVLAFAPTAGAQPADCTPPDAKLATAKAATTPIIVKLNGMPLGPDVPKVTSSQAGPGSTSDSGLFDEFSTGGDKPLVRVQILKSDTSAKVTASPILAEARGITELANLEVNLPGAVLRGDVIRADAKAWAKPDSAFTDNNPSTMVGLRLNDEWVSDVEPGNTIPLPEHLGAGSYIRFHERIDKSALPSAANPFYRGDVEVTMIYIVVQDLMPVVPGEQKLEIMIAKSWAQAKSPVGCFTLQQSVRGAAYTARVWPDGWYHEHFTFGYQSIGKTGGTAGQALFDQKWSSGDAGSDDATLTVESLKTTVNGVVTPGVSSKTATTSEVKDVCVLYNGESCFVKAGAIKTQANAIAMMTPDGVDAYEWGHTILVDVEIAGTNVCHMLGLRDTCAPPPNTKYDIPLPDGNMIHITLNEQWGDPQNCRCGWQGLNVRAIRIEYGDGGDDANGEAPGNILIARSYAAAEFRLA